MVKAECFVGCTVVHLDLLKVIMAGIEYKNMFGEEQVEDSRKIALSCLLV